jgi:hypothetical protein
VFVVTLFRIFFPDCLTLSLQRDKHRYDDLNSTDPGDIPEDIRELVQGMTQMEEMLCALASPCFLMWVSTVANSKCVGMLSRFHRICLKGEPQW